MADAATATADEEQAKPVKRGMPTWLVIVICVLIAAGAAGGAVYFVASDSEQASAADGEQPATSKPKGPAIYVKLDPPFVVNFESSGMMRFLQVTVEVLTRDAATAELLRTHDAKIRNDLLLLLGNQNQETLSSREGKEGLRAEALEALAGVIEAEGGEAGKLEALYFTSFVMQ